MQKLNTPNAGKLISSLRSTGYDSYSAISDIIDNSIDAGAKHIKVAVRTKEKEVTIVVADNGVGMTEEVLEDALKLGSMFEKDERSDLGKYGMGLITASISMAKKLEVITKTKGGDFLYASQDIDDIVEKNEFIINQDVASPEQIVMFKDYITGDSGTVVIISKVDQLSDSNLSQFSNTLAKDLSETYRKFLFAGTVIELNDKAIEGYDPLLRGNEGTEIFSDEDYDFIKDGLKYPIRVTMAVLPIVNESLEKDMKMNMRTQGFYVMRNNRQIAKNETFNLFAKHPNLNRLRIELSFDSNLDTEMGLRFTKAGLNPKQGVSDFLKQEIGGQISTISSRLNKERVVKGAQDVNHRDSADLIAKRAKLLLTPQAEIESRGPKTNGIKKPDSEPTGTTKSRDNLNKIKTSPSGVGAKFETVSLGYAGVLYNCYQEKKIIVVQWNIDHPFYEKVIIANKGDKNIVSALDYLVFGFAAAEMRAQNDDNVEVLNNIKAEMSSNLRALLS